MDNTVRGLWCEFMVAEALGQQCKAVGFAWHPWDLQFGDNKDLFPDRIRIQVKNSARLQSWHETSGKVTDCKFGLTWRKRPEYFAKDFPDTPCEDQGFMCDLFILCHHPGLTLTQTDHRDPTQWEFFLLPTRGPNIAVTKAEIAGLRTKISEPKASARTERQPHTLIKGIRGRPPIKPLGINELTLANIKIVLGLNQ